MKEKRLMLTRCERVRRFQPWRNALLAKHAGRVVLDEISIWVQVVLAKYH